MRSKAALTGATLLVVLFLFTAGTADAVPWRIDHDRTVDFSAYRTWAFDETPPFSGRKLEGHFVLAEERIRQAITAQLIDAGLDLVEPDEADFLVRIRIDIRDRRDVPDIPHRHRSRWGQDIRFKRYTPGTCVVDVLDGGTEFLAWRGATRYLISSYVSDMENRILVGIEDLFAAYPPQP